SSTKAPGPDGLGFECIKMAYRAIPDYFHTLYEVLKKLRVRYNHSQRKTHTKFFAKLFSYWLKTPLFRLHPLFYRERSPQTTFIMSSTSSKGKKKTTFNPDIPPFQHLVGVSPTAGSTVLTTSSNKQPRSETVSSLAGLHKGESNPAAYWHNRFKRENRENGDLPTSGTLQLIVGYLGDMQRDYITLLDKHSEEIWKLQNELSEYRHGRIA